MALFLQYRTMMLSLHVRAALVVALAAPGLVACGDTVDTFRDRGPRGDVGPADAGRTPTDMAPGTDEGMPPPVLGDCEAIGSPTPLATVAGRTPPPFDVGRVENGLAHAVIGDASTGSVRWFRLTGEGATFADELDAEGEIRSVAIAAQLGDLDPWISTVETRNSRPLVAAGRPFSADFPDFMRAADTDSVGRAAAVDGVRAGDNQVLVWREQSADFGPFSLHARTTNETGLEREGLGINDLIDSEGSSVTSHRAFASNVSGVWVTAVDSATEDGFRLWRLDPDGSTAFDETVLTERQLASAPAVSPTGQDQNLFIAFNELTAGLVPRVGFFRMSPSSPNEVLDIESLTPGSLRGSDPAIDAIESFQALAFRQDDGGAGTIEIVSLDVSGVLQGTQTTLAAASTTGGPIELILDRTGRGWVVWADIGDTNSSIQAVRIDCAEAE